ncbi:hypothetical protein LSCM1_04315 [Leishmania martiniquensis]|uniref:Uncharacterized protein n=1 Tax=Leishmania martiniquensis TaxID=1580590 RepID=A0A836H1V8_9TRYP|nr:hypothetical protein LSCM1_04315 [Leishmania martiniquensis]
MPFWKNYIYTKPEVDDDDLPLPQFRLFDDDGHIRDSEVAVMVTSAWRRSSTSNASANSKKSPPMSHKRRASLLKSVGAKPTTPLKVADLKDSSLSLSKPTSRSPFTPQSPRRATSPEPQPVTSADSKARMASPKKSSPKKSASKQVSPKKSSPPSPARARSPSPAKPKPAAKTSAGRRRSRSRSRSNSRRRAAVAPSTTPSPKWTLAALREFASENSIELKGVKTKAGILSAIHGSS